MEINLTSFKAVVKYLQDLPDSQVTFENGRFEASGGGLETRSCKPGGPGDPAQNAVIRSLLANALARDLGTRFGGANKAVSDFMRHAEKMLFGEDAPGSRYGSDADSVCYTPLTARVISNLLTEAQVVSFSAAKEMLEETNPELLKQTQAFLAEFGGRTDDAAKQLCIRFHQDVVEAYADIADGRCGVERLVECHNRFTLGAGQLRIREQLAKFEGESQQALADAKKTLGDLPGKFGEAWNAICRTNTRFIYEMRGLAGNPSPDQAGREKAVADHAADFEAQLTKLKSAIDLFKTEVEGGYGKNLATIESGLGRLREICEEFDEVPELNDFQASVKGFVETTEAKMRGTVLFSGRSAASAAAAISAFVGQIDSALAAQTGRPVAAAPALEAIVVPELRLEDAEGELAAFVSGKDAAEEASASAEYPRAVSSQLQLMRAEVDRLIALSATVPDAKLRVEFETETKAALASVEAAVADAVKSGIDLSDGVAGIITGTLRSIQVKYAQLKSVDLCGEIASVRERLDDQLKACFGRIKGRNPTKAVADALTQAVETAQVRVDEVVSGLYQSFAKEGSTVPRHAVRDALALLEREVERFVGTFDTKLDANDRSTILKRGLSFVKGSKVPMPAFDASGVSKSLATSVVGKPIFSGVAMGAYATLEDLKAATRSHSAFVAKFGAALDELLNDKLTDIVHTRLYSHLDEVSEEHPGCDAKFVVFDEAGRPAFTAEGLRVVKEVIDDMRAEFPKTLEGNPPAVDGEGPVSLEALLAKTQDSLDSMIDGALSLKVVIDEPQAEEERHDVYPRGNGFFGFDIDALKEDELAGLKDIVERCLSTKGKSELKAKGRDVFLDELLKQRSFPMSEDGSTDWSVLTEKLFDDIEKLLHSGHPPLEQLTGGVADIVLKVCDNALTYDSVVVLRGTGDAQSSRYLWPFAGLSPAEVLSALEKNGVGLDRIRGLSTKEAESLYGDFGCLYLANDSSFEGIDGFCQRVFHLKFCDFVDKVLANPRETAFKKEFDDFSREVRLYVGNAVKSIRQEVDPLVRANAAGDTAARFLLRKLVLTPSEAADAKAFYKLLRSFRPGEAKSVAFTFKGVKGRLAQDASGRLTASLDVTLRPGTDGSAGKTATLPLTVPVDAADFARQLEDDFLSDVKTYGKDLARTIISADVPAARLRQMCTDVIVSVGRLRAADLCHVSNGKLREVATALLDPKNKATAEKLLGAAVKGDSLNSAGTLETYKRLTECRKQQGFNLRDKVDMPDPPRRREGESLMQAQIRQLHEFASDLVQPADTTGYDLDRQAGMSQTDILRKTLLAHQAEIKMLLRNPKLVETFDLPSPSGDGQKLTAFKDVIKTALASLKAMYDDCDRNFDTLFGMVAEPQGDDKARVDKLLSTLQTGVASASGVMLERLQSEFEAKLRKSFTASKTDAGKAVWKQSLDELSGGGSLDVDSGYGKFLMGVIKEYFTTMADVDKSRMAALVMRYANSESSVGEALGALLKGAGPILQKLMQGLPQTTLPPDLRDAVADLKCKLAPIPEEAVRAYLLDLVDSSDGKITKITVTKSLGAASVGQAFLCTMFTKDHPEGEECVIKILRPDVQSRALREESFFKAKAEQFGLKDALSQRFERIFEELDLVTEARNVLSGAVYDPEGSQTLTSANVRSMQLHPGVNPTMNVMVLKRAPGDTLENYLKTVPGRLSKILSDFPGKKDDYRREDGSVVRKTGSLLEFISTRRRLTSLYDELITRQKLLSDFIAKWAYEGAFGNGFFHGDLHAGNIMIDGKTLTVIDFGNATKLKESEQDGLMWQLGYVAVKSADKVYDMIESSLPAAGKATLKANKAKIMEELKEIASMGRSADVGAMFCAFLQRLQTTYAVELPGSLFNLKQSMERLDEAMRLITEQLNEVREAYDSITFDPSAAIGGGGDADPEADAGLWLEKICSGNAVRLSREPETVEVEGKPVPNPERQQYDELVGYIGMKYNPNGALEQLAAKSVMCTDGDARRAMREDIVAAVLTRCTEPGGLKQIRAAADRLLAQTSYDESMRMVLVKAMEGFDEKALAESEDARREFANAFANAVCNCLRHIAVDFPKTVDLAPFEEPGCFAEGLGAAVMEGMPKFKAKVISNPLNWMAGKALDDMQNALQDAEVALNDRISEAWDSIDAYGRSPAPDGVETLKPREIAKAKGLVFEFRAPLALDAQLKGGKWAKDAKWRGMVVEALKENLGLFRTALAKVGLSARVATGTRSALAYARIQAIGLAALRPDWKTAFKALSAADLKLVTDDLATEPELLELVKELRK